MKLSTRGEYGVRAMYDLAMHYSQGPVSLKAVAERQGISEHYLEQLMGTLRKAGLVQSVRGALGGYELGRPPSEISVGDVIRVLEGPIAPVECVEEGSSGLCRHNERCAAQRVWRRLTDSMTAVLDSFTLENLCTDTPGAENPDSPLV